MKRLTLISFLLLIVSFSAFPQTQLLKLGNAAQFFNDPGIEYLNLTVDKVIINNKAYFKIKNNYSPWINSDHFQISYERIEGDSVHYILSSMNSDSLIFNFNWLPGKIVRSDTNGNFLRLETLDSIKIKTTFAFNDTVYYLGERWINIHSGDTISVLPATTELSKKFGRLILGMWTAIDGVKINGIRYGNVLPYPEEIKFSVDSLYAEFVGDTVNCYIINTSNYNVILDSILTSSFYGYLMFLVKDEDYFFINLFNQYPNYPLDTLNYTIPALDSIQLQIYDVDLCPICKKQPQEYFEDTLSFVFSFHQEYDYNFSKIIPINGEGHPSDAENYGTLPNDFALHQNYPNPFNPSTTIRFELGSKQFVALRVFNSLGQHVKTLIEEEKQIGKYEIDFDAASIPSGVYFYQLEAGGKIQAKKMLMIR